MVTKDTEALGAPVCVRESPGPLARANGSLAEPISTSAARYRRAFVVTSVTNARPADPSEEVRIGSPFVLEPSGAAADAERVPNQ